MTQAPRTKPRLPVTVAKFLAAAILGLGLGTVVVVLAIILKLVF